AGLDRWSIVRTVLVFGTGDDLGRSNIALWIVDQLSKANRISVVTDQFRTPTYVDDLARGVERIVRFNKSGIYHISGRELMSVHEFAEIVAEVFELDPGLIDAVDASTFSQTAPRPPKTGFIILKAETELGFKPRSLREALTDLRTKIESRVSSD
ncbi:MAG: NAD(P)-dependent oxidoreductase, partial [Rhodothermia bacterium]|nr:NAD(P)-dependent oxidoreductase [Rhodothermia bacterium]